MRPETRSGQAMVDRQPNKSTTAKFQPQRSSAPNSRAANRDWPRPENGWGKARELKETTSKSARCGLRAAVGMAGLASGARKGKSSKTERSSHIHIGDCRTTPVSAARLPQAKGARKRSLLLQSAATGSAEGISQLGSRRRRQRFSLRT